MQLGDSSPAGIEARRHFLADALAELARVPRDGLDPAMRTSLAVTESAFRTASEGMALPYGVATIGSWRNTPYAVIQNVGACLDVPQLLDGDQPVKNAADAEAYCTRLSAMAGQLDGETARIAAARGQGLVPPGNAVLMGALCALFVAAPPGRFLGVDSALQGRLPRWLV